MVLQAKVKLEPRSKEPPTPKSPGVFSRFRKLSRRNTTTSNPSSDVPEHTRAQHTSSSASEQQTPLKR